MSRWAVLQFIRVLRGSVELGPGRDIGRCATSTLSLSLVPGPDGAQGGRTVFGKWDLGGVDCLSLHLGRPPEWRFPKEPPISANAQRETQCWSRLEVGAAELPAGT